MSVLIGAIGSHMIAVIASWAWDFPDAIIHHQRAVGREDAADYCGIEESTRANRLILFRGTEILRRRR